ncbi:hypothetical protein Tco_0875493 [Tanacetum coccineum]|uniref:Uncharacterized protein n=1 Tax=Tanacetum coccineum TaxID=301880 RepID=A0ABQ5BSG7_9ASTR
MARRDARRSAQVVKFTCHFYLSFVYENVLYIRPLTTDENVQIWQKRVLFVYPGSDKQPTLRSKVILSFCSIGGVEVGIQLMKSKDDKKNWVEIYERMFDTKAEFFGSPVANLDVIFCYEFKCVFRFEFCYCR